MSVSGPNHEENMANIKKAEAEELAKIQKQIADRYIQGKETMSRHRAVLGKIQSDNETDLGKTESNNLMKTEGYKTYQHKITERSKLAAEKNKETELTARDAIQADKQKTMSKYNAIDNIYKNSGFLKGRKNIDIEKIINDKF